MPTPEYQFTGNIDNLTLRGGNPFNAYWRKKNGEYEYLTPQLMGDTMAYSNGENIWRVPLDKIYPVNDDDLTPQQRLERDWRKSPAYGIDKVILGTLAGASAPFAVAEALPALAGLASGASDAAMATKAGQLIGQGVSTYGPAALTSLGATLGYHNFIGPNGYAKTLQEWENFKNDPSFYTGVNLGKSALGDALDVSMMAPLYKSLTYAGKEFKRMFDEAGNYIYPSFGRAEVPEGLFEYKPTVRTKLGDVEIDNPELAYRQGDAAMGVDFLNTGVVRVNENGFYKNPMFKQGSLFYGDPYNKPNFFKIKEENPEQTRFLLRKAKDKSPKSDLLVSSADMQVANNRAMPKSAMAAIEDEEGNIIGRITSDEERRIPIEKGVANKTNTSLYRWEPGYGYREIKPDEGLSYTLGSDLVDESGNLKTSVEDIVEQIRQKYPYVLDPTELTNKGYKRTTDLIEHIEDVVKSAQEYPLPKGVSRKDYVTSALYHDLGKLYGEWGHGTNSNIVADMMGWPTTPNIQEAIANHMQPQEYFDQASELSKGLHAADVGRGRPYEDLVGKYPYLKYESVPESPTLSWEEANRPLLDWSPDNWFKNLAGRLSYTDEEAAELAQFIPEYRQIEKRLWNEGKLIKDANGNVVVEGNQHSEGGQLNNYKKWNDLSIGEKSEMMKVAIRNGITNLADIKAKYNEFAEGGYIPSEEVVEEEEDYGVPVDVEWPKSEEEDANIYSGTSTRSQQMNQRSNPKQAFLTALDQSLRENGRFNNSQYRRLFTELANMESGYSPNITNSIGAKGYFQLMPYNRSSSWNSPTQQFHEMYNLVDNNLNYFNKNLTKKDWERANALGIDMYGMLAGAHLGGASNVLKALRGQGNAKDTNGSSVMGYMTKFSQSRSPQVSRYNYSQSNWPQGYVYDVLPKLFAMDGVPITVSSGYRPGAIVKGTNRLSNHGKHKAADIVGDFAKIQQVLDNPYSNVSRWMLANGYGYLNETSGPGGTTKYWKDHNRDHSHYHIGMDSSLAQQYASRFKGMDLQPQMPQMQQPVNPYEGWEPMNPQAFYGLNPEQNALMEQQANQIAQMQTVFDKMQEEKALAEQQQALEQQRAEQRNRTNLALQLVGMMGSDNSGSEFDIFKSLV